MEKRDFLKWSAAVSAWVASGRLPLLAEPGKSNLPYNLTAMPEIEPIGGAIKTFQPKPGALVSKGNYTLLYDVFTWKSSVKQCVNDHNGTLSVARRKNGRGAQYTVVQSLKLINTKQPGGFTLQLTTDQNEVPVQWEIQASLSTRQGKLIPESVLDCSGSIQGNRLTLDYGKVKVEKVVDQPVYFQWGIPHLIASGKAKRAPLNFTMLEEALKLKPNQQLAYQGRVDIPTDAGTIPLDSYMQTGEGIQPTHYLADEHGCVQVVSREVENQLLSKVS